MRKNAFFKQLILPIFTASLVLCQPAMADDDEDDTPLAKAMGQTSDALKSLRKMDKSDWTGAAKAARTAADGCRQGMEFIPVMLEEMKDGKEKAKALADYRRMMGLSYAALCELELAYLEEDQAKVDVAMKNVKAGKKEGHKKYEDE